MALPHFSSEFNEFIKVTNGEVVTIIPDCSVVLNVHGLFFLFIGKLPVILFLIYKTFMHDFLLFQDGEMDCDSGNKLSPEADLKMVSCFTGEEYPKAKMRLLSVRFVKST